MFAKYDRLNAKLVLEDGTILDGIGFGYPCKIVGEVVFNTGMVGYTEALTDPSYRGQMLTLTYPMVGNYGVPSYVRDEYDIPKHFEADSIQPRALIIHELSPIASHWDCSKTLDEWLYEEHIPGIHNIDTRELTKKLRVEGVMMGALKVSDEKIDEEELFEELKKNERYDEINFVPEVSVDEVREYGSYDDVIVLIDTGVKYSIIRNLLRLNYKVIRLPYNADIDEVKRYKPKGVLLSNGPGDPKLCNQTVKLTNELFAQEIPTLGICLGNQIMALAAGADTYKLKYGHRGQNKPCMDNKNRAYVTSQNHGYCIDPRTLEGTGFEIWFRNADDNTVEGIIHKEKPFIAVQFHPEASPGPYDCMFVFEAFDRLVKSDKI